MVVVADLREQFDGALEQLPEGVRDVIFAELSGTEGDEASWATLVGLASTQRLAGGKLSLFNGQFAGIPMRSLLRIAKAMGYKGVQLCTWGPGGLDVVRAAGADGEAYCAEILAMFEGEGMTLTSISDHINCQGLLDTNQVVWPKDNRLRSITAPHLWPAADDGDKITTLRTNIQEHLKRCALAAKRLGVTVVNGFIGSQIWEKLFDFPTRGDDVTEAAYLEGAVHLVPVLREFERLGIRFALEVHPTELVYSFITARAFLKALKSVCEKIGLPNLHLVFGFCFDPSHFPGQGLDPVKFVLEFRDRIFSFHAKDSLASPAFDRSYYCDHLRMGDPDRHWLFMSGGRGSVNWYLMAVALIKIGYRGEITVEWEQYEMLHFFGLHEAAQFFIRAMLYPINQTAFDAAFAQGGGETEGPLAEAARLIEALRAQIAAELEGGTDTDS